MQSAKECRDSSGKCIALHSLSPILGFQNYPPTAGVTLRSPLPVVLPALRACFSFSPSNKIIGITKLTESRPILARFRLPERIFNEFENEGRREFTTSWAIEFSNSHQFNTDSYYIARKRKFSISLILEIESPNGTNEDEYPCSRTTDRKNI